MAPMQVRLWRRGAAVRQAQVVGLQHVPFDLDGEMGGAAGERNLRWPSAGREEGRNRRALGFTRFDTYFLRSTRGAIP